ncbi:MAG: hypothetical protein WC757_03945 [Candidatus Paceibacterota bacterium]|jgi:hypothetical protein
MGGLVAVYAARLQNQATGRDGVDRMLKAITLELIDTIDSYLHIAYRDDSRQSPFERQRLRRRIQSLTSVALPEEYETTKDHLDKIHFWWLNKDKSQSTSPTKGIGYTASESFFQALKNKLNKKAFGIDIAPSKTPEPNV